MSAEVLRRAAALMTARAEAATPGPWESSLTGRNGYHPHEGRVRTSDGGYADQDDEIAETLDLVDAEHIASWHPAVALAVADLLDRAAYLVEFGDVGTAYREQAIAVARAYLSATETS